MKAHFEQLGNDLFWSLMVSDGEGGYKHLRWQGYNDSFWWNRVSVSDQWSVRQGYKLNAETNEVTKL